MAATTTVIARSEYAVELYDEKTDNFWLQIDVFDTLEAAETAIKSFDQAPSGFYYGVLKIDYDEDDNEIDVERIAS